MAEARAVVGVVRANLFPQTIRLWRCLAHPAFEADEPRCESGHHQISRRRRCRRRHIHHHTPKADLYANLYQAGIDLSYEVDLWGRLRRATEAARAELLATENAQRTIVSHLVADVARNYFQLRELDLELEIAERTYKSRMESERLIRLRFEHGRADGLELERAVGETASDGGHHRHEFGTASPRRKMP